MLDVVHNHFFEIRILYDCLRILCLAYKLKLVVDVFLTLLSSPFLSVFNIWDDDAHSAASERIAIDKSLGDPWRKYVDTFNLLWGDVFSLGKLEDILGSVDNLG